MAKMNAKPSFPFCFSGNRNDVSEKRGITLYKRYNNLYNRVKTVHSEHQKGRREERSTSRSKKGRTFFVFYSAVRVLITLMINLETIMMQCLQSSLETAQRQSQYEKVQRKQ